jgi:4-hydroxybenzoate polyprenyltransferase
MQDVQRRSAGLAKPPRSRLLAGALSGVDILAFSSLLPAGAAAAMVMAAAPALGVAIPWSSVGLAAAGTLVVYNIDRLRDVDRDRQTAPLRSRFVSRNRQRLQLLTLAAAIGGAASAALVPRTALWLCGAVLAIGLLHRRLKRFEIWKRIYVTVAWVAVTAGLPAVGSSGSSATGWLLAIYTAVIASNLAATALRGADRAEVSSTRRLLPTRAIAVFAAILAMVGPPGTRPLLWLPLAQLAGLAAFRPSERYSLVVLDGSLAIGALVSLGARPLIGF